MATTTGKTSSSGTTRRLIGVHRRTLLRRVAALQEAVRSAIGMDWDELEDSLTDPQVQELRTLSEEIFLENIDFLYDVQKEAIEAFAKLQTVHEEFMEISRSSEAERLVMERYLDNYGDYRTEMTFASDVIASAKMILDTYQEIAQERNIDTSMIDQPDDQSSAPSVKPLIRAPPLPLPRRVSSTIDPSNLPIQQSNAIQSKSIQTNPIIQSNPIRSSDHPSILSHPNVLHSHPSIHPHHLTSPVDSIPVSSAYPIPTLFQQAAIAGNVHSPFFDGDVTKFAEFRDSFESLFGGLEDLAKLSLLMSCLGPEPKRFVSNLRKIDRNFQTAMVILSNEYDNPHLVQLTLLSRLNRLPQCDTNGFRLRETYLTLNEIFLQLVSEDSEDSTGVLAHIVLSKLPPAIQCSFLMQNKDKPIRVMDILTMVSLEVERERIEAVIVNGPTPISSPPDPPDSSPEVITTRHHPTRIRDSHSSPYCRLCHQSGHYPDSCTSYPSLRDRLTVVMQRRLCTSCLGSNHMASECRTPRKCRNCKGSHHTAICESDPSNPPIHSSSQPHPSTSTPHKNHQKTTAIPTTGTRPPAPHITNLALNAFDPYFLRYDTDEDDNDNSF